jgi:hypothetical protein
MATQPLFLQPPPDVTKYLQLVKTVTPQLGKIKLPGGTFVFLAGLLEIPNAVRSQIAKHVDTKKKKDPKDNQRVVKVADAVECVHKTLRDPEALASLLKDLMSAVTNVSTNTDDLLGSYADKIANCIREHELRQDTPRNVHRTETHGRPAKGHGHGRKKS